MAIPFFEPRNDVNEPAVDQVDGHVISSSQQAPNNYEHNFGGNHNHFASPSGTGAPTSMEENYDEPVASTSAAAVGPSASDELVWKTLAVAMCKVLKEHYVQKAQGHQPFTSAVVQITPNGQVLNPVWK